MCPYLLMFCRCLLYLLYIIATHVHQFSITSPYCVHKCVHYSSLCVLIVVYNLSSSFLMTFYGFIVCTLLEFQLMRIILLMLSFRYWFLSVHCVPHVFIAMLLCFLMSYCTLLTVLDVLAMFPYGCRMFTPPSTKTCLRKSTTAPLKKTLNISRNYKNKSISFYNLLDFSRNLLKFQYISIKF